MVAVKGVIRNSILVLEQDDISRYEGRDVIVTFLDRRQEKEGAVDLDRFVIPYDRGTDPDEYIKELRQNDRI